MTADEATLVFDVVTVAFFELLIFLDCFRGADRRLAAFTQFGKQDCFVRPVLGEPAVAVGNW